jgi:hypothetical protein
MRYQDVIVEKIENAARSLSQSARSMPEEKLTWEPLEKGRSALSQLQECGGTPRMIPLLLRGEGDRIPADFFTKLKAERDAWKTIADCEAAFQANIGPALEAIRNYPDDRLSALLPVPWTFQKMQAASDLILDMYWNMSYHLGQINYIQTLYGDKRMHSGM